MAQVPESCLVILLRITIKGILAFTDPSPPNVRVGSLAQVLAFFSKLSSGAGEQLPEPHKGLG